jgi:hypothetical protein
MRRWHKGAGQTTKFTQLHNNSLSMVPKNPK